MATVYLVEDTGNVPGRIYACFASAEDAEWFASAVAYERRTTTEVVERTLYYGATARGRLQPLTQPPDTDAAPC